MQFKRGQSRMSIARDGFPVEVKRESGLSVLMATHQSKVFVSDRFHQFHQIRLWVDDKDWGFLDEVDYTALFAEGTPAPYGHGEETKLDPVVRDAREIVASRLKFTYQNTNDPANWWPRPRLAQLKETEQVLYKMQLYGPGGHFKPHRDTVHGETHMATRVMFLPSVFKGGDLVVRHDKREFRIQSGQCIFYTDCEHEVEPVTSGIRATLQFDVHGRAQSIAPRALTRGLPISGLTKSLRRCASF